MESSIADELYSEPLRLRDAKLSLTLDSKPCDSNVSENGEDDVWHKDGSSWNGSEELDDASNLEREWNRRHNQFHAMGYRNGFLEGKEASAQEGFNIGFKESVFNGFKWGIVRGVTSALACLPDELKVKLVETQGKEQKLQHLYKSVHSISTTDALKLYHDELTSRLVVKTDKIELSSNTMTLQDQSAEPSFLENYSRELQSIVLESPALQVHLEFGQ